MKSLILFCLLVSSIYAGQRERAAVLAAKFPGAYVGVVSPTGSMRPLFDTGDMLVIVPRDFTAVKSGDVVAFTTRNNVLTTHRAIRKTFNGWVTKGDATTTEDREPMTASNFSGVVVAVVR